jgi:hypothetical protein
LLDAGTGVGRLLERTARQFLSEYASLNVVLSNYTLDRVIGIACLAEIWGKDLTIYAPGPPLIDADPKAVLDQLLRPGLTGSTSPVENLKIVCISQTAFNINNIEVRLLQQSRAEGPVGIRLNNDLAYMTDADTTPQEPSFIEGCEFLLKQIPLYNVDYTKSIEALADAPVVRNAIDLAVSAHIKFVVPINIEPTLTEDDLLRIARSLKAPNLVGIAPSEGAIFRL